MCTQERGTWAKWGPWVRCSVVVPDWLLYRHKRGGSSPVLGILSVGMLVPIPIGPCRYYWVCVAPHYVQPRVSSWHRTGSPLVAPPPPLFPGLCGVGGSSHSWVGGVPCAPAPVLPSLFLESPWPKLPVSAEKNFLARGDRRRLMMKKMLGMKKTRDNSKWSPVTVCLITSNQPPLSDHFRLCLHF